MKLWRTPRPRRDAEPTVAPALAQLRPFRAGAATHPGRVRAANEDQFLVAPAAGVFAVADGMGGHEGGALASGAIVEALATIGRAVSAADLLARFEDRVLRANGIVHAIGHRRGTTVGSTLAALIAFEPHVACVWSGDSRVYRLRGGAIERLTRDHTEAQVLVDEGVLTPEAARTWPRRNVITRAIGVRPEPELDFAHDVLAPGDRFVICSDGLTGHVEDAEILARAGSTSRPEPQAACDALVALTLERGASDNVTVVVVDYAPNSDAPDARVP